MNEIQIFSHEEFGKIRTIEIDGETWFCGLDVCNALGYRNGRDAIRKHCKDRWVAKRYVPHPQSENKQIEMIFINESNLYRLIVNSKLEGAIRFENWIFEEVLPEIRRTGTYGSLSMEKVFNTEVEEKIESIVNNAINKKFEEIINQTVTHTANTLIPCFDMLYQKIDELRKNTDVEKPVSKSVKDSASVSKGTKNKIKCKPRSYQHSKIENLPQEVRHQVDEMIVSGKYSCQKIADFIIENTGIAISYMTVSRYKKKYFII